jgi:hypothetical protein
MCANMSIGGKKEIRMKLNEELAHAAIDGFKAQKLRIDAQITELRAMLSGSAQSNGAPEAAPRKHRKMSTAARRRIAMAQKARWAKVRGESVSSVPTVKTPKKKRRISPEGLKRIIAATKKRWRLQKAAAKAK